jgi:hypothetical protein
MFMSAFLGFFDTRNTPEPAERPDTTHTSGDDVPTGHSDCKIADQVWKSAIYMGPGGPVMRDR